MGDYSYTWIEFGGALSRAQAEAIREVTKDYCTGEDGYQDDFHEYLETCAKTGKPLRFVDAEASNGELHELSSYLDAQKIDYEHYWGAGVEFGDGRRMMIDGVEHRFDNEGDEGPYITNKDIRKMLKEGGEELLLAFIDGRDRIFNWSAPAVTIDFDAALLNSQSKINVVCDKCGGDDVRRDATAGWDKENQCWSLAGVQDQGYCEDCAEEVYLSDTPLSVENEGDKK